MAFARTAVSVTATTTNGNTNLTNVSSTAQLWVNMQVYGTGIQADTIITAIAGTTVTMSKAAVANGTAVAITGQYITQTGTDTDPTGLAAMTGVTAIDTGSGNSRRTIYSLGTNQLRIQGTLTHDPDLFEITTALQQGLVVQTGATYNYGIARTVNSQTTYSKGTGLSSTYQGGQFTNHGVHFEGGTINWNGGVIKTCSSLLTSNAALTSNSYDSVWQMWVAADTQYRVISATPTFNAITMQGITNNILLFLNGGWNAFGVKFERCSFQTPAGGGVNRTILNPVFIGNQSSSDLITNQTVNAQQVITVKNPDRFPVFAKLQNNAYADMPVVEALTLNVTDAANAAVGASEVVAYIKDTNNGARLNSTVSTYTTDRTYIASSATGGAINMGDVLTLVGVNLNLTSATMNYDYRSNFGNNSADFNIYLGGYRFLQAVTRQTLMGNGGRSVTWTMFTDTNVTLSRTAALALVGTKFAVDPVAKTVTVLANATYDELYDATKAYKYQGTQTAFETPLQDALIVTPSGSNLQGYTGWSLIVNTGVTLSGGAKFSYVRFGSVTLTGSGMIAGLYETNAGPSVTVQLKNVSTTGVIAVWHPSTTATELFQANSTGSAADYTLYYPPGSVGLVKNYARELYGSQRVSGAINLAAGLNTVTFVDVQDVGITQTTLATVQAYTAIDTPSKFYDRTAAFRLTEQGIKLGQIAARSGTSIEHGSFSKVIRADAASVYSITGSTITIKAASYEADSKYTKEIATPPATITAYSNEIISISIEDANGNSQATVAGTTNSLVDVWKITNATAVADYATGTKIASNIGNGAYRWIAEDGFKLVFYNKDNGVYRYCSMSKGDYVVGWYLYDVPTGGLTQEQSTVLNAINTKNAEIFADVNSMTAGFVETTDSLHAIRQAVDSKPTLAQIEASTVLATAAAVAALGTPLQAGDYVAPDNTKIGQIKTKVDALENADLSGVATSTQVSALGTPLQAADYSAPPTAATVASAVRTELATELTHLDADISSRSTLTAGDIPAGLTAEQVWTYTTRTLTETPGMTTTQAEQLRKVAQLHGVGAELVVTETTRTAGDVSQTITTDEDGNTTVSAA